MFKRMKQGHETDKSGENTKDGGLNVEIDNSLNLQNEDVLDQNDDIKDVKDSKDNSSESGYIHSNKLIDAQQDDADDDAIFFQMNKNV